MIYIKPEKFPTINNGSTKQEQLKESISTAKKALIAAVSAFLMTHSVSAQEHVKHLDKDSTEKSPTTVVVKNKEDIRYKNRQDFETIITAQDKLKVLYDEYWEKLKNYKDFNNLLSTVNASFDTVFTNSGNSKEQVLNTHGNTYSPNGLARSKGSDYSPSIFMEYGVLGDFGNYTPPLELKKDYADIRVGLDTAEHILRDKVREAEERLKANGALPKYKGCIGCFSTYETAVFETEVPAVKVLDFAFSRARQPGEIGPDFNYFDKNGKLLK